MRVLALALALIISGSTYPAQESALHGRVLEDHSGMALAAVSVRVSRVGAPGIIKEAETDRSGDLTITGLPPGVYQLAIAKANYMPTTVRVSAQVGSQPAHLVRLIRYGVIAGRLLPASTGGVSILEQVPAGTLPRRFAATSNAAGEFRAFGLPPGRYVVGTTTRGLSLYPTNAQPREFSISGGEEYDRIDVSNPQAQAESFAVAGAMRSAEPVSSYMVVLISPDRPSLSHASRLFTGPFSLPNILPGFYEVLVSAGLPTAPQRYGRMRFSVTGQAVENLEVPVTNGPTAEFSVQSGACPQEATVATVTLSLLEAWTTPTGVGARVSAPLVDGKTARFERLFPSRYQVSVRDAAGGCYGVTDRILDLSGAAAAPRSIVLKPAPSIQGRVIPTNPSAPVSVVLRDLEPGRESPVQVVFARTGDPFSFPNLAPGRYCLALHANEESSGRWAPESGCAANRLDLSPGDTPEIELRVSGN
jgi:hypothetical protein